jgi:uncharacterized protein
MSEPWYREGLRFTCTRCGHCCTGEPGYVWVSPEELAALADYLEQPVEQVFAQNVRVVNNEMSLIERPGGDCVFWDRQKGCTVYPVRPTQCRTWPFWESTTRTKADWKRTQATCPGAGKGEHFSADEIKQRVELLVI